MNAQIPVRSTMVSVLVLRGNGTDTRVLLVQRAGAYLKGIWSYVAGHVEAGETGAEAALRELAEETGLAPAEFYATSFCEQFYDARDGTIQVVPAFVARVDTDAEVRLNREHAAFRWLDLRAAMDAVPFGSQRDLLAYAEREFIQRAPAAILRIV